MIGYKRERRECSSKFKPYLFFLLELIIYVELSYLIFITLGHNLYTYIVITLVLLYQLSKSLKRLFHVLNRCKESNAYKRYQEKLQKKLLQQH